MCLPTRFEKRHRIFIVQHYYTVNAHVPLRFLYGNFSMLRVLFRVMVVIYMHIMRVEFSIRVQTCQRKKCHGLVAFRMPKSEMRQ